MRYEIVATTSRCRHSLAIGLLALLACWLNPTTGGAADVRTYPDERGIRQSGPPPGCRDVWRCGPQGCGWRQICNRRCPDGISCFSLYGAYGPWGGTAYWGAYTPSGWGP